MSPAVPVEFKLVNPKVTSKAWGGTVDGVRPGFSIYCMLITTTVDESYQKDLIANLIRIGNDFDKNVFAAILNKGALSFKPLQKELRLKDLPAIVLTDTELINKDSFRIILENEELLSAPKEAFNAVEKIILLMLSDDEREAAKKASMEQDKKWFKVHIVDNVIKFMKNIKVSLGWGAVTIGYDGKTGTTTVNVSEGKK